MTQYVTVRSRTRDDGEKSFWISFADLMSALMCLFLLIMSVAFVMLTEQVVQRDDREQERAESIEQTWTDLESLAKRHDDVALNPNRLSVHFGDHARFATGSSQLTQEQRTYLQSLVPEILHITQKTHAKKWLKRVVVEGFADPRGDYLFNLNLSLQRSQRVLCALVGPDSPLALPQKKEVISLFWVGGYASNVPKVTMKESRRIELRFEYYTPDEVDLPRDTHVLLADQLIGHCRI